MQPDGRQSFIPRLKERGEAVLTLRCRAGSLPGHGLCLALPAAPAGGWDSSAETGTWMCSGLGVFGGTGYFLLAKQSLN